MTVRFVAIFALFSFLAGSANAQSDRREVDCLLHPDVVTRLGSPVAGILSEVLVKRGDFVKQGQYIGKLESGVEEVSLELARARAENAVSVQSAKVSLEFQKLNLDRVKKLHARSVSTTKSMEEAERETRLAEIELEEAQIESRIAGMELKRAQALLEQRVFHSPVNGVVVERSLSPGEYVYEQTSILTIAKVDPLRIEAFVPITLYRSIEPGMEVDVRLAEPVGGVHRARVTVVDRVFDAASGTFGVRMTLPNPELAIPAGLRCKVSFPAP